MSLIDGLLTLTIVHFIATISPGPEFMLISKESLCRGRKVGFLCLAGTMLGLSIHLLYSAFGLATIISDSPNLLFTIQLIGGGYLLYLGGTSLLAKPKNPELEINIEHNKASSLRSLKAGFICDVLNPKAPIYYLSLFTFVLSPNMPTNHIIVYGGWIMMIHFIWFSAVILMLSNPIINKKFVKSGHWIDRILGGFMIAIGLKVIMS